MGIEQIINTPIPAKAAFLDLKTKPHKTKVITKNSGLATSGKTLCKYIIS